MTVRAAVGRDGPGGLRAVRGAASVARRARGTAGSWSRPGASTCSASRRSARRGPGREASRSAPSRVRVGRAVASSRDSRPCWSSRARRRSRSADPDGYFLHPTTPPPATFRFAPSTVRRVLVAAAAVLVLLAAALLAPLVRRSRARAPAAQVDPLERALALVRAARTRPPPDRRRALGLLSRTLALARGAHRRTDRSRPCVVRARARAGAHDAARGAHRGAIVTSQIPLADGAELAPAWRRTRAVRVALAVALVVLVIVDGASRLASDEPPAALPAEGVERDRRSRPLGEHLVRHLQPDRRDARRARLDQRALRAGRVLRCRLRGAATGNAELGAAAVRPLLQGAEPADDRARAGVSR